MSRAQAESVIKNIIREIAQECASKGQAVSETLVAFMVSSNVNRVDVNASVMMYPQVTLSYNLYLHILALLSNM